ncbi:hypothetical protein jhhlp_002709 [Lomentospora prolificans]|uniref:Leucine-rich repeat-containing protein 40 n=1 Tax=Lomentospora prolificans TaxID=41688 RepID=A0A2N3NES9_9PEZI|nr:hypothetical protein jhhlp_002709 [Lomentospora prolificans]
MEGRPAAPSRPSAIPRLSRLPVPKTVRPSASRESLNAAPEPSIPAPRVRPAASRERLSTATSSSTTTRRTNTAGTAQPPLRQQTSRPSLRASASNSRLNQQPPARKPAEPARRPSTRAPALTRPAAQATAAKRLSSQPTRPSGDGFISAATLAQDDVDTPAKQANRPVATFDDVPEFETPSRMKGPRPSLSERTIETLSRVPSSPALSKRPSSFFDQGGTPRPRSRASSSASRPGSSYNSDGPRRPISRGSTRPGSSSGGEESLQSQFRASTNTYKAPLPTIDGTPIRGLRARASLHGMHSQSMRSPQAMRSPSSPLTQGAPTLESPRTAQLERSPSPTKHSMPSQMPSPTGTLASKPLRLKPSSSLLVKKSPGGAARGAGPSVAPRKVSTTPNKPIMATSTMPPADPEEAPSPSAERSRKSSAALREQIAKARAAAKKPVAIEPDVVEHEVSQPATVVHDGFDFGLEPLTDDPFNLNRSDKSQTKVLQQRAEAGRTSGRLNIAALGLKEMPEEVMKMYDLESVGNYGGNWAESMDLTRLVAADNEFEVIDDAVFPDVEPEALADIEDGAGNIFGGLEMIDLHGNKLVSLPMGLRQLRMLTSLNLSQNQLHMDSLQVISQISALRDLKLANNSLSGPLPSSFSDLEHLEILDLHGNKVSELPADLDRVGRLRILNIGENDFTSLPFECLAKLPLTELIVRSNKLSGTLIDADVSTLSSLQTLDVSSNQLTRIVPPGRSIGLPALHQLTLSMNRLQGLPDVSSWTSLVTLSADENSIPEIPEGFTSLDRLRHVDFTSNDIRVIPPEVARMDNLAMLRIAGNPLRDKKFSSISTDELKDILSARLEPPPPYHVGAADSVEAHFEETKPVAQPFPAASIPGTAPGQSLRPASDEDSRSDMDDYATPPTSAPHSPARSRAHTLASQPRSRAQTLSNQTWPVKVGGLLDRSSTSSSTLHPVVCSKVASEHRINEVQLHHNLFSTLPEGLSFFAESLTALSLAHNQLMGETYLAESLELPALRELNLANNHITNLVPLATHLKAPDLEKLDVSFNRVAGLPTDLRTSFPKLAVLLVANNHLIELDPEAIRGMRIVDASNNDIAHLNPRIGLLGGPGGLERLDVMGNRFRVPRFSVLERGTDATLRWLRGRVPAGEAAAWRQRSGGAGSDLEELD